MFFKIKKSRLLDFLVIGTQKGGTSALDYYLKQHAEIVMAEIKEVHFFDNESVFSKRRIDYSELHKHFNFATKRNFKFGEATPIYLYWHQSCRRIWSYNPDIKLIAILRNPVERAFSHWNMEVTRKAENKDFSYCIRNEIYRTKEALPDQHRVYSYVDRGFYAEQIRRYFNYFDKNQLLFLKYEDFKVNQEKELEKIWKFLEVDPLKFDFKQKDVNMVKYPEKLSEEDRDYLIQIYKNDIAEVERLLGWDCKDWIK